MGIFRSDEKEIVSAARGDSITEERLFNKSARVFKRLEAKPIVEYLDDGEQPHFLLKGPKTGLKIQSPKVDETKSPDGSRHSFFVVTDQRIHILIGQKDDDEHVKIEFGDIKGIWYRAGIGKYKIHIKLHSGSLTYFSDKSIDEDELEQAIDHIKQRKPDDAVDVNARPDLTNCEPDFELEFDQTNSDGLDLDDLRELIDKAESGTVTVDRLEARNGLILDNLREDEQPHFVLKGNPIYGVKVEGGTSIDDQSAGLTSPLKTAAIRGIWTVLTDQRALILVVKTGGTNTHSVPYDSIVGVDRQEKVTGFPLILQTHGRTYYADISKEDAKVWENSVEFLEEQISKSQNHTEKSTGEEIPAIEQLERLKKLYDDGALTDEEFEKKKSDLLDKM